MRTTIVMGASVGEKLEMVCGTPSSRTRKFSFFRPGMMSPCEVVATTSTVTMGTSTAIVTPACGGCCAVLGGVGECGFCCCCGGGGICDLEANGTDDGGSGGIGDGGEFSGCGATGADGGAGDPGGSFADRGYVGNCEGSARLAGGPHQDQHDESAGKRAGRSDVHCRDPGEGRDQGGNA